MHISYIGYRYAQDSVHVQFLCVYMVCMSGNRREREHESWLSLSASLNAIAMFKGEGLSPFCNLEIDDIMQQVFNNLFLPNLGPFVRHSFTSQSHSLRSTSKSIILIIYKSSLSLSLSLSLCLRHIFHIILTRVVEQSQANKRTMNF
jgi:hypothetical protein